MVQYDLQLSNLTRKQLPFSTSTVSFLMQILKEDTLTVEDQRKVMRRHRAQAALAELKQPCGASTPLVQQQRRGSTEVHNNLAHNLSACKA